MNNEIVDLFPKGQLRDEVKELVLAAEEIAKKEPIVGFHHSFYVPGWIGAIQEMVVNSKMHDFESKPYFHEKSYTDFAQWLIDSSAKISELQKQNKPDESNSSALEEYNIQSKAIVKTFSVLIELWVNSAPEVATMFNRIIDSNVRMSLYGIVYQNVSHNLRDFGFKQISEKPNEKGFLEEGKDMLYRLAGMFINILIFGIIVLIITSIID